MDIVEITNLISSIGFPIVMCLLFFKWFTGEYKHEQEQTREIIEDLKETVNTLKTVVENMING